MPHLSTGCVNLLQLSEGSVNGSPVGQLRLAQRHLIFHLLSWPAYNFYSFQLWHFIAFPPSSLLSLKQLVLCENTEPRSRVTWNTQFAHSVPVFLNWIPCFGALRPVSSQRILITQKSYLQWKYPITANNCYIVLMGTCHSPKPSSSALLSNHEHILKKSCQHKNVGQILQLKFTWIFAVYSSLQFVSRLQML